MESLLKKELDENSFIISYLVLSLDISICLILGLGYDMVCRLADVNAQSLPHHRHCSRHYSLRLEKK